MYQTHRICFDLFFSITLVSHPGQELLFVSAEMEFFEEGGDDDDEDRAERMIITKCYSTVKVSTNDKRMDA